jgi:hypothetical protein
MARLRSWLAVAGDREVLAVRVSTVLAVLALVLLVVNGFLVLGNQTIRTEVAGRQQYINQTTQIAQLNQELINALATASVKNKNTALRDILTANGITVTVTQPPAGGDDKAGAKKP